MNGSGSESDSLSDDLFEGYSDQLPNDPLESLRGMNHAKVAEGFVRDKLESILDTSVPNMQKMPAEDWERAQRTLLLRAAETRYTDQRDQAGTGTGHPGREPANPSVAQTKARFETEDSPSSHDPHQTPQAEYDPSLEYTQVGGRLPTHLAFRPLKVIGQGGFGEVWEAEQMSLGRVVALKQLKDRRDDDRAVSPAAAESFQRLLLFRQEAYTAAFLEHPNVVPVYDLTADEHGNPVIAMKRVYGRAWSAAIEEDFSVLSVDEFLARHLPNLIQVAQAVAFAHSRSIIHRDIKPSQVMIGEYGEVLLMDWGLAVSLDPLVLEHPWKPESSPLAPTIDWAQNPAGTPSFMAPEQARTDTDDLGPWTDVYLLGATLFFLLAGRPPHLGRNSREVMNRVARGVKTTLQTAARERPYPRELAELCEVAMNTDDPRARPTVRQFIKRLRDFLAGDSRRRESMAITREVAEGIENPLLDYRDLALLANQLANAQALWPANPEVRPLRDRVHVTYASRAIANGDLMLARVQAGLLDDGPERIKLLARVDAQKIRIIRHQRQRKIAVGGVVLLLIVSVLFGSAAWRASTISEQRREEAETAMKLSQISETAAIAARQRAEREQYFASIGFAEASLRDNRSEKTFELLTTGLPDRDRGREWGILMAGLNRDRMVLDRGALNRGTAYFHGEFSTDDSKVFLVGKEGHFSIWDTATGVRLSEEKTPGVGTWTIRHSPAGGQILLTGTDGVGRIVEAETRALISEYKMPLIGRRVVMRGGDLSPDGKLAATVGTDGRVNLWSTATGEPTASVEVSESTYSVAFSPDGRQLAVTSILGGQAALVDVASAQVTHRLPGHGSSVLTVVYNQDGSRVLTASSDGMARQFDAKTGALIASYGSVEEPLRAAAYARNNRLIVASTTNGLLKVWSTRNGELLATAQGAKQMEKLAVSNNGNVVLSVSFDEVRLWDLDTLAPDAQPSDRNLSMAEIDTVIRTHSFPIDRGPSAIWQDFDAEWIKGTGRTQLDLGKKTILVDSYYSQHDPSGRFRVAINYDTLASQVFSTSNGELLTDLLPKSTFCVRFSPDSSLMAVGTVDSRLLVYETAKWTLVAEYTDPENTKNALWSLDFSPDGSVIAMGWQRSNLSLWSVAGKKILHHVLKAHDRNQPIVGVSFSPDGTQIVTASSDETSRVWNAADLSLVSVLRGHTLNVLQARFTPDGLRVVTLSMDDTSKLWDPTTGREIITVVRHRTTEDSLVGFAFSREGQTIYYATRLGRIMTMESMPWKAEELNCQSGEAYLRCIERWKRQYRLGLAPDQIIVNW